MQRMAESRKVDNLFDDNSLVLDIETSGVSRIHSYVVVASTLDSNGTFTQLSISSKDDEAILLENLFVLLDGKKIITFNGKTFDIPFLKARYTYYNLQPFEESGQFDLYRYFIKNRPITDMSLFSLQDIEKYNELERFENFEIEEDSVFYDSLVSTIHTDDEKSLTHEEIKKICLHNKYDVINTEKLLSLVDKIEKTKYLEIKPFNPGQASSQLKIDKIYHDKNILFIDCKIDNSPIDRYYNTDKYELTIHDSNLKIKVKILEGYISKGLLGQVHILDTLLPGIDNGEYTLPPHILLIFDGRYKLTNIKLLIKHIITRLAN